MTEATGPMPKVGDYVICEGWAFGHYDAPPVWISKDDEPRKVLERQNLEVAILEGATVSLSIGLRSIIEIVKPAEKEKPEVPISDEQIEHWKLLAADPTFRWVGGNIMRLIARIEADRETSKDNHRRMEKLSDEASRWENECERLRAQNAEQAQEIARLKWTIADMEHRCQGAPFPERRKGERRVPYCRFDCCRKVTDRRRLGHDRRKAK